jgi:hypothetical protein
MTRSDPLRRKALRQSKRRVKIPRSRSREDRGKSGYRVAKVHMGIISLQPDYFFTAGISRNHSARNHAGIPAGIPPESRRNSRRNIPAGIIPGIFLRYDGVHTLLLVARFGGDAQCVTGLTRPVTSRITGCHTVHAHGRIRRMYTVAAPTKNTIKKRPIAGRSRGRLFVATWRLRLATWL